MLKAFKFQKIVASIARLLQQHYHWAAPLSFGVLIILLGQSLSARPEILIQVIIFVAITWYSFETRELRKSARESVELEQKPIVDFYWRLKTDEHPERFRLRNSGKGVAYNVHVSDLKIDGHTFSFSFDEPNRILSSNGDEKTLHIYAKTRNGGLVSGALDFLKNVLSPSIVTSRDAGRVIDIVVAFEDARRRSHHRTFQISCPLLTNDFQVKFVK